jgi:hypothetical protein
VMDTRRAPVPYAWGRTSSRLAPAGYGRRRQPQASHVIAARVTRSACQLAPDEQITESCPTPFAKIFRFAFTPNQIYIPRRPVPSEGRFAIVIDVGSGMRWTRQRRARAGIAGQALHGPVSGRRARRRTAHVADGEVVWSWHPLLVLNRRRQVGPTGSDKP